MEKKSGWKWLLISLPIVILLEMTSLMGQTIPTYPAIVLSLLLIFGIGYETLWRGIKALFHLEWQRIELLMLIAVVGAFFLKKWEEAAVVIVLYTLAEKLEDLGIEKSKASFKNLVEKMPQKVEIKGKKGEVLLDDVNIGDVMIIRPGKMIALDGYVKEGSSFVDESTMTGEPIPKDKSFGDLVFAGTFNKQGKLEVEVTKKFGETSFSRIQKITSQALKEKAQAEKFIEKFAKIYTPSLLFLAIFWAIIPTFVFQKEFSTQFLEALTLLVISCPCALVIATPVSIYSAVGRAAKEGALIKGGRYLEQLSRLKAIAFDKTGTLTLGKPFVEDLISFSGTKEEDLLSCAAGIEAFSEHPLAFSVAEKASEKQVEPHKIENFEAILGKGIKADCLVCDEKHHCLGKLSFILEEHKVPEEVIKTMDRLEKEGKTTIILSSNKKVKGILGFSDTVRKEAKDVIQTLSSMGLKTALLTGDNALTAEAVRKKLDIDFVQAELLPHEKAEWIQDFEKMEGKIAMVGDGVNDSPALATASVGIALTDLGSDTAIDAASILILKPSLSPIPFLIRLGKRTVRIIQFNTFWAIGIKLIFILLALFGKTTLAFALLADVGVTLFVIANSLRIGSSR